MSINTIKWKSIKFFLASIAIIALLNSCSDSTNTPDSGIGMKIAVFSDVHFYDPTLGTSGEAWDKYLKNDRKLLAESSAITESLVNAVLAENPNVVIVSGDLTKEGEKVNHEKFASYLKRFTDKGIKVYVIPGNHDINNSWAASFSGSKSTQISSVTPAEFETIYKNYGFSSAIARDPNSLTYIVEPVNGVWLFCMDGCRYAENTPGNESIVSGTLKEATKTWIENKLQEAKTSGKLVLGTIHHALLEHFMGQSVNPFSADYVIKNFATISASFAEKGMKAVFTGHYHANDVTLYSNSTNFLFDIETGSTVTAPCPYRIMTLTNDKKLDISTKYITSINYDLKGATFKDYAYNFTKTGIDTLVYNAMTYPQPYGYGLPITLAKQITPVISDGFMAHYAGDEELTNQAYVAVISAFQANSELKPLGDGAASLWYDLKPADNNVILDLTNGQYTKK